MILSDLIHLKNEGALPVLNLIQHYERDDENPFFPTDVYSFHVDRSPIPTSTFLCTYFGAVSEVVQNDHAKQKVLIPEIRNAIQQGYSGPREHFEDFLEEEFLDLHYTTIPNATITKLGIGQLWKLAVDHPQSQVPPCIHRAPKENCGELRLLLIC